MEGGRGGGRLGHETGGGALIRRVVGPRAQRAIIQSQGTPARQPSNDLPELSSPSGAPFYTYMPCNSKQIRDEQCCERFSSQASLVSLRNSSVSHLVLVSISVEPLAYHSMPALHSCSHRVLLLV